MFEPYAPRAIYFVDTFQAGDWHVKVYQQTKNEQFSAQKTFDQVLKHLDEWVTIPERTSLPVYQHAFVIVHEAREGVWILLFWWTGGEMLNRSTWFASYNEPVRLLHQPESDRLVCVWELEIVLHERKAWIDHILCNAHNPDFEGYRQNHVAIEPIRMEES